MADNAKCKRGCKWPTYQKRDRWGDEDTYCLGCNKPVEKCDCRKEREKAGKAPVSGNSGNLFKE